MMQPIVLRLPEEARAQLEIEAKTQKQSLAEIIRRAIDNYLKTKPKQRSGAEALLDWAKKSKVYPDSLKDEDISATYKEYLYGPKSPKFGHLWKKKK